MHTYMQTVLLFYFALFRQTIYSAMSEVREHVPIYTHMHIACTYTDVFVFLRCVYVCACMYVYDVCMHPIAVCAQVIEVGIHACIRVVRLCLPPADLMHSYKKPGL
jgi:hypothetical protein